VSQKIPVTLEHARLRAMAARLASLHLDDPELSELALALHRIGCGEDSDTALGINRGKGQSQSKEEAHYKIQQAIRWIAGYMNPGDGSTPLKTAAISEAAELFGLDHENLTRACPNLEKLREIATFNWDSQRPSLSKS